MKWLIVFEGLTTAKIGYERDLKVSRTWALFERDSWMDICFSDSHCSIAVSQASHEELLKVPVPYSLQGSGPVLITVSEVTQYLFNMDLF